MAVDFASSKTPTRSSMESFITGSLKAKENCTLLQETITLESLGSIRRKAGESTPGQGRKTMSMKESLKQERETAEVLSGGQMAVGTKASLEMECKAVGAFCIGKADIVSTKAIGITGCLMVKVPNTSKTVNDTREPSNKISFTEREFSTKMTQLSMAYGKITSCLW